MSRGPRTLGRNDRLQVADDLMRTVRCRHLPVLDERGRLAGIVSQRDLFRALCCGRSDTAPGLATRCCLQSLSRRSWWRSPSWHQMEDGGVVLNSMYSSVGTRIAPGSAGRRTCCRRQMVSGFGQDIDACVAVAWRPLSNGRLPGTSRSSAAATVGYWQRSTAGGEHRSGRIWPRLRGCVLNSARS